MSHSNIHLLSWLRSRPHLSGYFWIRNFFLSGCGFLPHVSGESSTQIHNFLNTLWIQNRVDSKCGYFFYPVRVTRSSQFLCREYCILNYIQDGNLDACSLANIPRRVLVIRVDPDMYRIRVGYTCGWASLIWIRIRVDVEIFESGKIGPKHSPREKKYKKVVDSGFHEVDFGFPVMDCGFFVSGTWNPDSNR